MRRPALGTAAVLALVTAAVAFPFYWMALSSTKTFAELFALPPRFWPRHPTLAAYRDVLFTQGFLRYLANSLVVAGATVGLDLAIAAPGAYALARLRFRFRRLGGLALGLIYLIPPILLVVPLFALLTGLGLRDSLAGLVVAYLAQTLPVSLYMLANYFRALPPELEEAARVDGCSRPGVLVRVVLPLSAPALTGVGVYTFLIAWNEFLLAYILLDSPERFTVAKGLYHLFSSYHTAWDRVMAASVLMTVPVLALFLVFQRRLVAGLTAGGVKGA
ncbi:MAG: carbohydrate ABC transporter permease [Deltaproteobacteria bacterium]|nr:carbohydrate ABC transporter permease [Deltaproteobacteria bacterium]